jgi:hypothetical protein
MFLVNCVWLTAKLLRIRHEIVNIAVQLLLIIVSARSIAKSTITERIYRNQFLSFSLLIDASLNTVAASL